MRKITVEPEALLSCATRMEDTNQEYLKNTNEFFNVVEDMSVGWQGKDNLAFTNKISKFQGDFKQLSMLCMQYTEFLNNSAHAYQDTQNELMNQANGLMQ